MDGTTLIDVDCATDITDAGATEFTATSGQTVTVNRAGSGYKTALVTRPIWLFGGGQYLQVADNDLLDFGADDDFTVMAVVREHAAIAASSQIITKWDTSGGTPAWQLRNGAGTPAGNVGGVLDGTSSPATGTTYLRAAGELATVVFLRDAATNTLSIGTNNSTMDTASDTTTGTLANSRPVRIGAHTGDSPATFLSAEIIAAAVWRRVLTTDDIAAINNYYGTV
jgi:hypothetical protein